MQTADRNSGGIIGVDRIGEAMAQTALRAGRPDPGPSPLGQTLESPRFLQPHPAFAFARLDGRSCCMGIGAEHSEAGYHDHDPFSAENRSARAELIARAKECAPTLVGLDVAAAQAVVDATPGVWVRFVHGRGANAMFGVGRVTARVRDGVVTQVDLG